MSATLIGVLIIIVALVAVIIVGALLVLPALRRGAAAGPPAGTGPAPAEPGGVTVLLLHVDPHAQAQVVRVLRDLDPSLGSSGALALVGSAPVAVARFPSQAEAEEARRRLIAAGALVEIR